MNPNSTMSAMRTRAQAAAAVSTEKNGARSASAATGAMAAPMPLYSARPVAIGVAPDDTGRSHATMPANTHVAAGARGGATLQAAPTPATTPVHASLELDWLTAARGAGGDSNAFTTQQLADDARRPSDVDTGDGDQQEAGDRRRVQLAGPDPHVRSARPSPTLSVRTQSQAHEAGGTSASMNATESANDHTRRLNMAARGEPMTQRPSNDDDGDDAWPTGDGENHASVAVSRETPATPDQRRGDAHWPPTQSVPMMLLPTSTAGGGVSSRGIDEEHAEAEGVAAPRPAALARALPDQTAAAGFAGVARGAAASLSARGVPRSQTGHSFVPLRQSPSPVPMPAASGQWMPAFGLSAGVPGAHSAGPVGYFPAFSPAQASAAGPPMWVAPHQYGQMWPVFGAPMMSPMPSPITATGLSPVMGGLAFTAPGAGAGFVSPAYGGHPASAATTTGASSATTAAGMPALGEFASAAPTGAGFVAPAFGSRRAAATETRTGPAVRPAPTAEPTHGRVVAPDSEWMVYDTRPPASHRAAAPTEWLDAPPVAHGGVFDMRSDRRQVAREHDDTGSERPTPVKSTLPTFASGDFEDWFIQFQNAATLHHWTREPAVYLLKHLAGAANEFAIRMPVSERMDYDTLVRRLRERFIVFDRESIARRALDSALPMANESPSAYWGRLQDLNARLGDSAFPLTALFETKFRAAVSDADQRFIRRQGSLAERLASAEALFSPPTFPLWRQTRAVPSPGVSAPPGQTRVMAIDTPAANSQQPGSPRSRRTPAGNGRPARLCFVCRSPDHMLPACPVAPGARVEEFVAWRQSQRGAAAAPSADATMARPATAATTPTQPAQAPMRSHAPVLTVADGDAADQLVAVAEVLVCGAPAAVLFDSGSATASLVHRRLLERLPQLETRQVAGTRLTGAFGAGSIDRMAAIPIVTPAGASDLVWCFVVDDASLSSFDVLLSLAAMRALRIDVLATRGVVRFGNTDTDVEVPLRQVERAEPTARAVCVLDAAVVHSLPEGRHGVWCVATPTRPAAPDVPPVELADREPQSPDSTWSFDDLCTALARDVDFCAAVPATGDDASSVAAGLSSLRSVWTLSQSDGTAALDPRLVQLQDRVSARLTEEQRAAVMVCLARHVDAFAVDNKAPPPTMHVPVQNIVDTGEATPVREKLRPKSQAEHDVIDEITAQLLANGQIRPSRSPWASNPHLVPKPDGSRRMTIDYRRLNAVTQLDAGVTSHVGTAFDAISTSRFFTILDCASGFWSMRLSDDDARKTAFVTRRGQFEFVVMPFGLKNAPVAWLRFLTDRLGTLLGDGVEIYADDIFIHAPTFDGMLDRLDRVLAELARAPPKLNANKAQIGGDSVQYLGFRISAEGRAIVDDKAAALAHLPVPTTVGEARALLGMFGFYRPFLRDFATLARPISQLLANSADGRPPASTSRVEWTPECQAALDVLRRRISTAPVLQHLAPHGELELHTDASDVGLGGILMQTVAAQQSVVEYYSKAFTAAERNYTVSEREALAVVASCVRFDHHIIGRHVKVLTDHAALRFLLETRELRGRLMRWALALQRYDLEIHHRAGMRMAHADALSRAPPPLPPPFAGGGVATGDNEVVLGAALAASDAVSASTAAEWLRREPTDAPIRSADGSVWEPRLRLAPHEGIGGTVVEPRLGDETTVWTLAALEVAPRDDLPALQLADPLVGRLIADVEQQRGDYQLYRMSGGVLYRVRDGLDETVSTTSWALVVPASERARLLRAAHDEPTAGHLAFDKTYARLRTRYYWPNIYSDVRDYVRQCELCQRHKSPHTKPPGYLVTMSASRPFAAVAIDFVGPLPVSATGNSYILVMVDYFSKWPEAVATVSADAVTFAGALVAEVVARHGVPARVVSDQGAAFMAELSQAMFEQLGVRHATSTPYHQQANGQVERFVGTLRAMMATCLAHNYSHWDRLLPLVLFAYRTAVQSSSGYTPAMIVYGRELVTPADALMAMMPAADKPTAQHVAELRATLADVIPDVIERQTAARARYATQYDKERTSVAFRVGDLVLRSEPTGDNKFDRRWSGPYRIMEAVGGLSHRIEDVENAARGGVVHVSRLKPYVTATEPAATAAPTDGHYTVESIRDARVHDGRQQYRVRWAGYTPRHDQWVDADDVDAPELVAAFRRVQALARDRSTSEGVTTRRQAVNRAATWASSGQSPSPSLPGRPSAAVSGGVSSLDDDAIADKEKSVGIAVDRE